MNIEPVYAKDTGETLVQHTENCLRVFKYLKDIYPEAAELCGKETFFEDLFYALFLHDFGKASTGFQKHIKEKTMYDYRHEILSAGFISLIDVSDESRKAISLAIISHHKDLYKIRERYNRIDDEYSTKAELYKKKVKEIEDNACYLDSMFSLLPGYFAECLCKGLNNAPKMDLNKVINGYEYAVPAYIEDSELQEFSPLHGVYGIFLKGFLTACDHLSSASVYEIKNAIDNMKNVYKYDKFTSVQIEAMKLKGNSVIVSPTGSGKTEASLFWSDNNQNAGKTKRVYYVLPYTASINAMFRRLKKDFYKYTGEDELIGLMHGKASYFIYKELSNDTENNDYQEIVKKAKEVQDLTKKIFRPYKIMTPFQILKSFFGIKGFEQGLAEMTGGLFILDEIHAYNPRTTALILECLKVLRNRYDAKILIMTATMPTFLKNMFIKALEIKEENCIAMQKEELLRYTRHRVKVCKGDIYEHLDLIKQYIRDGKKVLVVCNTVTQSQKVFDELKIKNDSSLLHGRFILKDRERIEQNLDNLKVLVGTQAIEVSLDIDYDVLFTEPAPIDALLQRFGRVNRRVHKKVDRDLCPVYIFENGSDKDEYIYDPNLVCKTLDAFSSVEVLTEELTQELIDLVYSEGYSDKQAKEFSRTCEHFNGFYKTVVPFIDNETTEDEFYRLFDSFTVVPLKYKLKYLEEIENGRFYEAMGYTLGISSGQFYKLMKDNKVEKDQRTSMYCINCVYDENIGLKLDEYPSNIQ